MFNKLIKVFKLLFKVRVLISLLKLASYDYLYEIGWTKSVSKKIPVNCDDEPIPWVTYGFIHFIEKRLKNDMSVFEFGSGYSTIWYAKKVNSIICLEHDKDWFEKIKNQLPENAIINYCELIENYYNRFLFRLKKEFDIIIIDGRQRVECIKNSISNLKDDGVMVLDDSERKQYTEGIKYLLDNGFKQIDFWGISPCLTYKKCTTIFYKSNNCLGI